MPDTTDPELCSLIANLCKPLKHLTFQKLSIPLGLLEFEEIPSAYYSR